MRVVAFASLLALLVIAGLLLRLPRTAATTSPSRGADAAARLKPTLEPGPRPHARPREAIEREARRLGIEPPRRGIVVKRWGMLAHTWQVLDVDAGVLRSTWINEEDEGQDWRDRAARDHTDECKPTPIELAYIYELFERAWGEVPRERPTDTFEAELLLFDGDRAFSLSQSMGTDEYPWTRVLMRVLEIAAQRGHADTAALRSSPRAELLIARAPRRGIVYRERRTYFDGEGVLDADAGTLRVCYADTTPGQVRHEDELVWLTPRALDYLVDLGRATRAQRSYGRDLERDWDRSEVYVFDGDAGLHVGSAELHHAGALAADLMQVMFLIADSAPSTTFSSRGSSARRRAYSLK